MFHLSNWKTCCAKSSAAFDSMGWSRKISHSLVQNRLIISSMSKHLTDIGPKLYINLCSFFINLKLNKNKSGIFTGIFIISTSKQKKNMDFYRYIFLSSPTSKKKQKNSGFFFAVQLPNPDFCPPLGATASTSRSSKIGRHSWRQRWHTWQARAAVRGGKENVIKCPNLGDFVPLENSRLTSEMLIFFVKTLFFWKVMELKKAPYFFLDTPDMCEI